MILAMDISLSSPGFSLLTRQGNKFKVLDTLRVKTSGKDYIKRVTKIGQELQSFLLDNLDKQPEPIEAVVQERSFTRFNKSTQAVFLATGAVFYILGVLRLPPVEKIAPKSIKQAIALNHNGQASKEEVAEGVRSYLVSWQKGMEFESDDVSDSIAAGITYYIQEDDRRGG